MHPHLPAAIPLIVVLAAITVGYLITCMIWPFGPCRRCHGEGKLRSPVSRRTSRYCPRCHHTGLRLRIGRRVINRFRTIRTDAHTSSRTGSRTENGNRQPGGPR